MVAMSAYAWTLGRPASRLVPGGMAIAVCLLLTLSSASGSPSMPLGKLKVTAPYKGSVTGWNQTHGKKGCTQVKVTTPEFFNLTTGVGGFSGSALQSSCTSPDHDVVASGAFFPVINMSYHGGPTTLFVNSTYSIAANLTFSAGTCAPIAGSKHAYCNRGISLLVYEDAALENVTTGVEYDIGEFTSEYVNTASITHCRGVTCHSRTFGPTGSIHTSGTYSWEYNLSAYMVKSYRYAIALGVQFYVNVGSDVHHAVLTGFNARASMNVATRGNGIVLSSIVET